MNPKVHVLDHPLIQHKLTMLRDENTETKSFRELVREISLLMGYEATRELTLKDKEVKTPLGNACGKEIEKHIAIVPILRAGLAMSDALCSLIPSAKVGHIGIYRDPEAHVPVEYYCKLPSNLASKEVIVLDPMLATGGSAVAAIDFIKQRGAKSIKFMCIIAVPEGIETLSKGHPDVDIYCGTVDEKLNEDKYIVPGLGDVGNRLFGTL